MALNSAPYEWDIYRLVEHLDKGPMADLRDQGLGWGPARPFGMFSVRNRIRLAWMVFTGRADALIWPGQMPKAY